MNPEMIDLTGIASNLPLAAVVAYLFKEVQKLHEERLTFMSKQLDIFQKLALELKLEGEGNVKNVS